MLFAASFLLAAIQAPRPPQAPTLPPSATSPAASYGELRAQAIRQGVPLVVFVGQPSRKIPGMLSCPRDGWEDVIAGVVVSVPWNGDLLRFRPLPVGATDDQIRAEVLAARAALAPRQPRQIQRVISRRDCPT